MANIQTLPFPQSQQHQQKCKLSSSQAGINTLQHNVPKHCHGSRRVSTAGSLRTTSKTWHCSLPAPWFLHTLALEGPKCASLETHCQTPSIFNRQAGLPKQSEKHALRSTLSGHPGQPLHRSRNSAGISKLGQKKTQNKSECGHVWKHSKWVISQAKHWTSRYFYERTDSFSWFMWERSTGLPPPAQTPPMMALLSPALSRGKDAPGLHLPLFHIWISFHLLLLSPHTSHIWSKPSFYPLSLEQFPHYLDL